MNRENTKRLPFFGIPSLLPYLRDYRRPIAVMVTLGAVSSLADSAYPLFNRYALNHFVAMGTMDTLALFLGLYVLVLLVQVASNLVSSYLISRVELEVGRDLKNAAFNHLQTLAFSYFNTNSVGYIHARVMSDTDRIGTLISWRMMDVVWNVSYILFIFVVMIRINLRLALLLGVLLLMAGALTAFFQKRLVGLNRKLREINSQITGDFNEGITGAKAIRTLVVEDKIREDFEEDTAKMRRMAVHTTRFSAGFTASVTMMASLALALVLRVGGALTLQRAMEIGTLSVFMSYALGMMDPIQYLIEALSALMQAQANIERFGTLMETESAVQDSPEVVEKYGDTFHPKKENWEPLYGDVEFRDVSFRYPDGEETVLEHFSLRVPKGSQLAIVGETGAGKSTLVNLVCRFYEPTEGQVLIDGRDARERSQLWLHDHIGYVLQTPHLFSGTVRDNLRYGKPEAADEEIWAALDLVSARAVVDRMGSGLDSDVGEGGDLLSTGEKQLLSFARAILADPAILVLDEATSSIDTMTEQQIQDALHKLIAGRTTFMIAHRLSTVVHADRILAVQAGKIVESGTHQELMEKRGYYYRLYTQQVEERQTEDML